MNNIYQNNLLEAFNCVNRHNWLWRCNSALYWEEAENNYSTFISLINSLPKEQQENFIALWNHYKEFYSSLSHTLEEVKEYLRIRERLIDHIKDYTEY